MSPLGRISSRLLAIGAVVGLSVGALAAVTAQPTVALPALPAAPASPEPVAYISVDANSGTVVAAHNEHAALPPASTIKLLTALVAIERLPLASTVPVSARAAAQPAMKISMTEGSVWKLDDALHALLIVSANDAAYAIAERVGGSIEGFAPVVQAEAKRLGLVDTTFKDPAGLDDGGSFAGGSRASAFDLAVVARNVLSVPQLADTAKLLRYEFTDPNGVGRSLTNHNKGFLTTYAGATGLKTGYTKLANRTLVTSATRDGRTCVAVNMGTWDDTGWAGYLLDQCFAAGTDAPGTGVKLPPVRAVTADARLAAYHGLPAALGRPALAGGAAATAAASAPASSSTTSSTTKARSRSQDRTSATSGARTRSGVTGAVGGEVAAAASPGGGSGGGGSLASVVSIRNVALVLVAVLLALFLLRRRAVRRQRARRIARHREVAEQRRRRMIDVVELHDRESGGHVRVVTAREHTAGQPRR